MALFSFITASDGCLHGESRVGFTLAAADEACHIEHSLYGYLPA